MRSCSTSGNGVGRGRLLAEVAGLRRPRAGSSGLSCLPSSAREQRGRLGGGEVPRGLPLRHAQEEIARGGACYFSLCLLLDPSRDPGWGLEGPDPWAVWGGRRAISRTRSGTGAPAWLCSPPALARALKSWITGVPEAFDGFANKNLLPESVGRFLSHMGTLCLLNRPWSPVHFDLLARAAWLGSLTAQPAVSGGDTVATLECYHVGGVLCSNPRDGRHCWGGTRPHLQPSLLWSRSAPPERPGWGSA